MTTYRVFGDLTDIPKRQIFSTSELPQMRMTRRPVIGGDGDRFGVLRRQRLPRQARVGCEAARIQRQELDSVPAL